MNNSDLCVQQFEKEYQFKLAKRTLYNYVISIKQLLSYSQQSIKQISNQDIRNWLLDLAMKGNKPDTIRYKLNAIKLFLRFCLEEEIVSCNPAESIPAPKREDILPRYLSEDQLEQLRYLVTGHLKERAVIELLYATGIRVSELSSIKKEDVMWSERTIIIQGKGEKERIVCFDRICEEHLQAYLDTRKDDLPYLIMKERGKGPMSPYSIREKFKEYSQHLGFKCTPHTLRHTFTVNLMMKGMRLEFIQSLLGHGDPQETERYAKLYNHAQKQKYDEWN